MTRLSDHVMRHLWTPDLHALFDWHAIEAFYTRNRALLLLACLLLIAAGMTALTHPVRAGLEQMPTLAPAHHAVHQTRI